MFLVARVLAHANGIGFDLGARYQWQLIEPALLESRLGESLLYLHAQPPLFNAVHGLVLKLFADTEQRVLAWTVLHLLFGLAILVSLYGTLRLMEVGRLASAVLTALYCCSPAALAYENSLSYTYLDAALVSAATLSLAWSLKYGRKAGIWAFFVVLTLLCLTRSAYHIAWLATVGIALQVWVRKHGSLRRTMGLAMALSLLAVGAVYLKNYHLFGFAGASSWMGMNLATMTHTNLDERTKRELQASGRVSTLVLSDPFQPLASYPLEFRSREETRVPVLDREVRSDGSPNFNHHAFIAISKQYGRDAVAVAAAYPLQYAKSAVRNVLNLLFRSSSDYRLIDANVAKMRRWDAIYSAFAYGQLGTIPKIFASGESQPEGVILKHLTLQQVVLQKGAEACLLLAAMIIILPVYCLRKALHPTLPQERALLVFIGLTLAYVVAVTVLANFGEAQRMRFEVEPLFMVLLGLFVKDLHLRRQPRSALQAARS